MALTIDANTPFGARVLRRLATEDIGWLTTVNAQGKPQPNPVWFLWDDGVFIVYSEPRKAKLANIRRNPGVSLNLETIDGGDCVVFTGTAEIIYRADLAPEVPMRYLDKYGAAIVSTGMTRESMPAAYSETIRFTPEKLRGF